MIHRFPQLRSTFTAFLIATTVAPSVAHALPRGSHRSDARGLIAAGLMAMGGRERLEALHSLRLTGVTYERHIYEAEPPDQPFYITYQQFIESRDLIHENFRRVVWTTDTLHSQVQVGSDSVIEFRQAGTLRTTRLHKDWVALNPERVLLTADTTRDLHAIGDTTVHGVHEIGVGFTWSGIPVRVWLNAFTNLPMVVEYAQSYPESISAGVWGDIRVRHNYGAWVIFPGGLHYPTQDDVAWNGILFRTTVIADVGENPVTPDSGYTLSSAGRTDSQRPGSLNANDIPLGRADRPATEIEPGVIQIPGGWYTTIVRQPDGIVIIEAPISSGYSAEVLAEAARRFPAVPVKAVITTSNYWWHVAGLREYAARGIPIYSLDANRQELESVISAPHRLDPDHLERNPRSAKLVSISGKTVIGSGRNRLELYPIRTSTTSSMLMVYMPSHQLLYSSDMAQPLGPNGTFVYPQYLWDLRRAVRENGLSVTTLIGMHMSPTPWSMLEETLRKMGAD